MLPAPPLLLITDRRQATRSLPRLLDAAFAAGCRWASVREKDLDPADLAELVRACRAVAVRHGATLTVHGSLDSATLCHGVHLGTGGDAAAARAALGPGKLVGVSCHGLAELRAAAESGADYATLSPIFPSPGKPGYGPVLEVGGLAAAVAAVPGLPVLALGGVEPTNAAACHRAGAAGIAVMGGLMRAEDVGAAVDRLIGGLRQDPDRPPRMSALPEAG